MIHVTNISLTVGGKQILKPASFSLLNGEIVVVLGKNGAGKSTLLKALTGIQKVDEGMILWDSQKMESFSIKDLSKMRAVLSQSISLNFPIKVRDLVEMGAYVMEQAPTKARIEELLQDILRKVEMEKFIDRDFNTLSGGEQKRILLAKCLLQLESSTLSKKGQFLFLDEPTASLDIQQQFKLLALVKKLSAEGGVGVFAVVHDINLASQFADRILLMKEGQIMKIGRPEEVLTQALLKEAFDIEAIISPHPVYGCPHITPVPTADFSQHSLKTT
ncbi:MAG: heme ABC transporter ATP-binding protein [Bacteroidota bacterium]